MKGAWRHPAKPDGTSAERELSLTAVLGRWLARSWNARVAAREPAGDLIAWGQRYLPHYFRRAPSGMHRWLAEQFIRLDFEPAVKLNVIGPRGGAKSTLATLALPLWRALERRESYIWLVSDSAAQAQLHLQNLRAEISDNALLRTDYPAAASKPPVWQAGALVLANGVRIEAFGTGQRIRGRRNRAERPTLIVCDDLQNDSHTRSAAQREHSAQWFHGTLLRAGTKRTHVLHVATALHRDALAMQLARTSGWTSRTFRAIERWPDNTSLWDEWERLYTSADLADRQAAARAFFDEYQAAMEDGAELLWPEEEDLYTLMCMRAESGRLAFEREKQGAPIDPDACEWPASYFDESIWFDHWPSQTLVRVLALDPSKGAQAQRGDYSAFVVAALDRAGTWYIEADLARRPTPQMVADGIRLYLHHEPQALGVEVNQYQELLADVFAAELRKAGLAHVHPWGITNHVSKLVRIRRLGPLLAAHRLKFKAESAGTRLLVEQLRDFPIADHDDGPDALEMAIRLASELIAPAPDDGLGSHLPTGVP